MQKVFFCLLAFSFGIIIHTGNALAQKTLLPKKESTQFSKKVVIKYGLASFYAKKFIGRKTSSGNIYNPAKLSAACNVLPAGTWIKVTNLKNKRTVVVQVNDRLHPRNRRLIDLSGSAAQNLGFISKGIIRVRVEVLRNTKGA